MSRITQLYTALGGRKTALGLLAVLLFVCAYAAAVLWDTDVELYKVFCASVLAALGLTSGFVAWEDNGKRRFRRPEDDHAA